MKKNIRYVSFGKIVLPLKCILWIKFNVILLFFFSIQSYAGINAQDDISLSLQNVGLAKVFKAIEKQARYRFVYKTETIPDNNVSIEIKNASLDAVLQIVLKNTSLTYRKVNSKIVVITNVIAKTVTGKVTDNKGEALIGVSVLEQGTLNGTVTNQGGNYSITIAGDNSILVFQHIGYETKTETIGNRTVVNVLLQSQEAKELGEIVVTALGIKKEARKLGYAASTVNIEEITKNRTTNVMTSLEGKIAGLNIAPPAAGAGASNRIRLRGQSGFAGGNNSPLIVINGLPMDQGARSAEGGGPATDLGDNLTQINQDDIESMTVLKGSTAAALYGSRASNGAIIITTKSGAKNSKFGVEITSNFTADEIIDFSDYQTEYGTGSNGLRPTTKAQAVSMGNLAWGQKHDGVPTVQYDGVSRPYSADKDRFKKFYNTGTSFMNTIALSGGDAATSYRVSFSNQDAKGISPGNSYHKKIFNLGLNSKVTKKLTLQANINYTQEEIKNPPLVGAQGIGFSSFLNRIPLTISIETLRSSVVNPDGSYMAINPFDNLLTNPYFLIGRRFDKTKRDRLLGTVSLRYDFTKWLYLQGRVNADFGYNNNESNTPHGTGAPLRNDNDNGWRGNYTINTSHNKQMNMDFLLGTNHKIGDFTIDGSFGGNRWTVNNNNTNQSVTDFVVRDIYSIANGITKNQNYSITRWQVNSLYGFADFGYKNFLYLNVTDRVDYFSVLTPPSSIVADPKNYFNYYSVGASFIFSELLPKISWLNYGKLRATYAISGNANGIAPFQSQLRYTIDQQLFGPYSIGSIANQSNPNPKIEPYKVAEKEIGLEVRTLKSRLNFDIAVYDKRTASQILSVDLSPSSGYGSTPVNIAKLKNTGLELMVEGSPFKTSNFSWNISANGAYNTSKVLSLNPGQTRQLVVFFNGTGNEFLGSLVYDVGKEMNQLIARTYMRNDKGQVMLNSQGRLQGSAKEVNFGSANSKLIGGITNTFQYKNLSLLIHVDGKFGGKLLSSTVLNGLRSGQGKESLVGRSGVVFDGVLPNGTQNTISVSPQIFYTDYRTQQIADPFVFSSDFIKLRNITLTYDLSRFMSSKAKFVKGLTVSAFCRNAAVLLKHTPVFDPEAFASTSDTRLGYEQHTEPTTRTLGLNLNVKF